MNIVRNASVGGKHITMETGIRKFIFINLLTISFICHPAIAQLIDTLYFGDKYSEMEHNVTGENSAVRQGGLGQNCRVILPQNPLTVSGGSVTFTIKIEPAKQNYLTARLWGGDVGETVLYLYHKGKQIGVKHSDWPPFDTLNWRTREPRLPGRFFYMTYLIPDSITQGRIDKITLKLVSKGYMYGYASTYEDAQHLQEDSSQGIYAVYTHTDPFFVPPADEPQSEPVILGDPRPAPTGADIYEYAKNQSQELINLALMRSLPGTKDTLGIAKAYNQKWYTQYKNPFILNRVIDAVDTYVKKDNISDLDWMGPGELAMAIVEVYEDAENAGLLDVNLQGNSRRDIYADFFKRAINYQTQPQNRGGLTNQDIYIITSVYRTNLLLKKISSENALSEDVALDYVYQAIGLRPYKGRHTPEQGVTQSTSYRYIIGGPIFLCNDWDYYWVTSSGSAKEHGFVCHYGEMAHQLATLAHLTGDQDVHEQAIKMITARPPFRVFDNDADGHIALRIESAVGWRHNWFTGRIEYADPYFKAAAVLQDPVSVRLAQLFIEHNRVFEDVDRPELPLMVERIDNLEQVLQMPPSTFRLPTRDDQPDFAWADEGIGALVFKHLGRRAWIVMNWRGAGINKIARVHFSEPTFDRIANIRIDCQFTPKGQSMIRPAEQCGPFVEPGTELATDGEILPLAAGALGGKGDFYSMRYGDYLIGMNCTENRTFELEIPEDDIGKDVTDLITGDTVTPEGSFSIQPCTTVVLYLNDLVVQ